jgi:hypothetical protein
MTRLAARLVAVSLLCACPFGGAVARGSPPAYQSPRHALYVACEKEAHDKQIAGWWARHKFIGHCIAEREQQKQPPPQHK